MNKSKPKIGERNLLAQYLVAFYGNLNQLKMTEDGLEYLRVQLEKALSKVESDLRTIRADKYIDE